MGDFWIDAFLNSLWIVLGVSIASTALALPMAWLVKRSNIRGANTLAKLLSLPYVVPSYLLAISWITLANPSVGWINLLCTKIFGSNPQFSIYNLGGIIFVESSALFATLFLSFRSALKNMDPSLEEAARLSGASPARILFKITCPLLKSTIVASLIAIALASLASFAVPAMIGSPARIFVLTTGIFSLLKEGTMEGQSRALAIAIEMGVAALALVALSRFVLRKQHSLMGGKSSRPSLVVLGPWRTPLSFLAWSLWGIIAALPLSILVLSSFQSDPGNFSSFGFKSWIYVLTELPDFLQAVSNSVWVSLGSAAIIILISLPLSLINWQGHHARKTRLRIFGALVEDLSLLAYSLPGTVIAVLLIFFATKFSFLSLSDTLGILILAMVVKYLTLGLRTVGPAAYMIHPSLIEAARLSGASFFQRLWRIWIPLLKPSLIASVLLVLMPSIAELTMSILLYGPGTETIGVSIFQLQEYADRASAAVVGSILLILVITFQSLAERLLKSD